MYNYYKQVQEIKNLEELESKYVDVYDLYTVLLDLFKDLNILSTDLDQKDKLSFKFKFPDELFENRENLVTFDIGSRKPAIFNGKTQSRDIQKISYKDLVTSQIVTKCEKYMQNFIRLSVYAPSFSEMLRIVKYLENVFYKHSGIIKQHVHRIELEEISETVFIQNNASQRLFSKTLIFNVITLELRDLLHEEIQKLTTENINK